jgi:hypothetical protein
MPDVSLSSTARINDDAVFRELDGESIVLNLQTGTYFGLDEVGTRVWQLIDRYGALFVVRDALVAEFEVDADTAGRDLMDLVSDLAERGLVDVEP